MEDVRWQPSFVLGMAQAATGEKGYAALRQFSKQIVLGASREQGDEDMRAVFARPLVRLFDRVDVLTHMTFANEAGRFRWVFTESWLLDPDAWGRKVCHGLVLVGMDGDARFFYVTGQEAPYVLQMSGNAIVLTVPVKHELLDRWETQWTALCGRGSGGFHGAETGEDGTHQGSRG